MQRGIHSNPASVNHPCWLLQPLGSLSNDDDDDDVNENGKKTIGSDWQKNNNLHVHHAFMYISLSSPHDYEAKNASSDFTFL